MKGHSGCLLTQLGNTVIKNTNHVYPIDRLTNQAKKQIWFYENCTIVKTPKIIDIYEVDNTLSVEMEYVGFNDALSAGTKEDIIWLLDTLVKFVKWEISQSAWVTVDTEVFYDKLREIRKRCGMPAPHIEKKVQQFIGHYKMPVGLCHGDLTFENMLISFSSREIVILDYLDCYLNSPYSDIVKLRQDTYHGWCLRDKDDIKTWLVLKYMDIELGKLIPEKTYKLLQLMNLYRILPYLHEESDIAFVLKEIDNV